MDNCPAKYLMIHVLRKCQSLQNVISIHLIQIIIFNDKETWGLSQTIYVDRNPFYLIRAVWIFNTLNNAMKIN